MESPRKKIKVKSTGSKGKKPAKNDKQKPRRKNKNKLSFETYIHVVLRQVYPDSGISKKALKSINRMVGSVFERLCAQSQQTCTLGKRQTISARDVQTACRVVLPGQLATGAVQDGTAAVVKYTKAK